MIEQRRAARLGAALLAGSLAVSLGGSAIEAATAPSNPSTTAITAPLQKGAVRLHYPVRDADRRQDFGDLFLPDGAHAAGSTPVVVLIHGGGWRTRANTAYLADAARSLQSAGLAVWSIEYRRVGSGGGWPTTFTDVGAAADYVADLARAAPSLDASNVILVGHSAGGQLAAWAAARRTLPAGAPGAGPRVVPRAFVSLAGVLDMRTSARISDTVRSVLGGTPETVSDRFALANPIQRIDPAMPSVAVHGSKDRIVPAQESADYVRAARAAGAQALYVPLDGAGHGEIISVRSRYWPRIREIIVRLAHEGYSPLAADLPR